MLYRLLYADAQQLQPYALARWSMPPADLLRQRLADTLGQRRTLLGPDAGTAAGLATGTASPATLRLTLEEEFEGADLSIHRIGATPERESNW